MSEPIKVNADALVIDDLVLLEDMGKGKVPSMRELRDLFDRAVEGGAGQRRISEMRDIASAIVDAIKSETNPKATEPVSTSG